jgi:uncharacterized membrane protein (Fun14 family)
VRSCYDLDHIGSVVITIGGGFFGGVLIGYALKKVLKVIALVVGLFFAGLAYLQYQHIIDINLNKLQAVSQNTLSTLPNATTQIPGCGAGGHTAELSNLGIPLTGHSYWFHEGIK